MELQALAADAEAARGSVTRCHDHPTSAEAAALEVMHVAVQVAWIALEKPVQETQFLAPGHLHLKIPETRHLSALTPAVMLIGLKDQG